MTTLGRDNRGKFARTLEGVERDREALRLRSRRFSYQQISDQLGYGSAANAHRAVKALMVEIPRDVAEELVQLESEQLDMLTQAALEVLEAHHYAISDGRIVKLPSEGEDGEDTPLSDDGPVLQAIDRLLKIQDRRSKLLGLDAPAKSHVTGGTTVRYEIVGVDTEALR